MKVLITGSEGFIGGHLSRELAENGYDVRHFDIRRDALLEDARNPENIARALDDVWPEAVVHLAAKVGRLFGEDNLTETIADNAAMTAVVAQACGARDIPLVYASTSEVYGDTGPDAVGIDGSEDALVYRYHLPAGSRGGGPSISSELARERSHRLTPHNIYGLSKRWGEEACRLYAPEALTVLRFSMPYGPGLPWGRGRAALVNFLHQAMEGEPIPVHRGSERSWCYIGDTVRAVRLVLEEGAPGAYNVGRDDNACPLLHVAELACDLVGAPRDLVEVVDAPARQTVVKQLATDRIRRLGWEPRVELEEGMAIVRDWIIAEKEKERAAQPERV